ncbi:hypothetical protein DPMN_083122 [Dreissena polymorpha]|uniref:Uncharacterized protein n=1 Tax=Dreissena polymorpha TaxID=45954 RepID=A0A9D4BI42_DREPO|nr:hypothetical protein DPMN_083122 [Dreissena polymorpha]
MSIQGIYETDPSIPNTVEQFGCNAFPACLTMDPDTADPKHGALRGLTAVPGALG